MANIRHFYTTPFIYRWKPFPEIVLSSSEVGVLFAPFVEVDEILMHIDNTVDKYLTFEASFSVVNCTINNINKEQTALEYLLDSSTSSGVFLDKVKHIVPFSLELKIGQLDVFESTVLNVIKGFISSDILFFQTVGLSFSTLNTLVDILLRIVHEVQSKSVLILEYGELNRRPEEFKYFLIKSAKDFESVYTEMLPQLNNRGWKLKGAD